MPSGPSNPDAYDDQGIYLVAAGHAHPPTAISSDDLATGTPNLEPGWSEERLGIHSRRVLLQHEAVSDLAAQALRGALDRAHWSPESIDMLVCGVSFVDDMIPATASVIARDLAPDAVAFDVNAACASVLYSASIAESMLQTRPDLTRVAVCGAERPSAWVDYRDRDASVFWGDSAGALLLRKGRSGAGFRLVEIAMMNDNHFPEKVRVGRGSGFRHDGRYSFGQVLAMTQATLEQVMKNEGIESRDLRFFTGHQSNMNLLHQLSEQLGVPMDRQWYNVDWAGNQSGTGVLTAFSGGWERDGAELQNGDYVALAAVGAGYSAGAMLLQWCA